MKKLFNNKISAICMIMLLSVAVTNVQGMEETGSTEEEIDYSEAFQRLFNEDWKCSICLSREGGGVTKLLCGHEFHVECINKWIETKTQASFRCPLCRQKRLLSCFRKIALKKTVAVLSFVKNNPELFQEDIRSQYILRMEYLVIVLDNLLNKLPEQIISTILKTLMINLYIPNTTMATSMIQLDQQIHELISTSNEVDNETLKLMARRIIETAIESESLNAEDLLQPSPIRILNAMFGSEMETNITPEIQEVIRWRREHPDFLKQISIEYILQEQISLLIDSHRPVAQNGKSKEEVKEEAEQKFKLEKQEQERLEAEVDDILTNKEKMEIKQVIRQAMLTQGQSRDE